MLLAEQLQSVSGHNGLNEAAVVNLMPQLNYKHDELWDSITDICLQTMGSIIWNWDV